MKILFVDDNELNRMVMEDMIAILFPDIKIDIYAHAKDVLEQDIFSYDIILSDIDMPDIDGFVLYNRLREDFNFTKPIIAVTALAVNGDRDKMLMHGFDDYISKPIDMGELEETLTKYM